MMCTVSRWYTADNEMCNHTRYSLYLSSSKCNKAQKSTSAHFSFINKRTDVQPVYLVCKAHLYYTYEWLVWKNTSYWANVPFIAPFIKNPPCLIRTRPPHMRYIRHWQKPKVFKLSRTGCALLHTEAHERDDEHCLRGM